MIFSLIATLSAGETGNLILPSDNHLERELEFVRHLEVPARHTYPTRVGEAVADAFTIIKMAGYSSVTISNALCT